ncbi:MAG TPA: amylo-alpha-1,6-glucosidase, partial [Thermoanaerobaculia bacterium]|nr:amylo-alpha-1,6-glucosidase [Thermoanaerobaculia bacterium]
AHLILAADQFIISPQMRTEAAARSRAEGHEPRTIIAGYHWFTDWGRDTMISLEGLTLTTGRFREAASILRTFATYVRDGLIPNMFPEGENEGLYHTADATMWFFHAVHRYVSATGDRGMLAHLIPVLDDIIEHHLRGTRFGIGVDSDGLLRQGQEGYALTWMDAKMESWVVTPRRGKAVEINALYYNALRLLAGWMRDEGNRTRASELENHAGRTRLSFNERFWYEPGRYLYDVVDMEGGGDDAALRPNQILSISLDHPVLDESRWEDVIAIVERRLLTPAGLRSLDPDHPDYKRSYEGDLLTRDGAYHQGTVWSWLIGPFFDAWRKVHPERRVEARNLLRGLGEHLPDAGVGSVSEIFEADTPHDPRGCIAQAWGVAELLRCLRAV